MSLTPADSKPNTTQDSQSANGIGVARYRLLWLAATALGTSLMWGVFTMYGSPNFVVDMANQLWSCF